jgi:TRAP-type mannitol/chloroaromatic compound transport system permease small subunit
MAAVVDTVLVAGVVCASAAEIASHLSHPMAMKTAEIGAAAALILTGAVYQALFILLAGFTPGMKYAHIALCTFDDERPTRAQLRFRLWAQLVSLLPVGLGVVWSVFDEEGLSWHDRLSRTYQRRY